MQPIRFPGGTEMFLNDRRLVGSLIARGVLVDATTPATGMTYADVRQAIEVLAAEGERRIATIITKPDAAPDAVMAKLDALLQDARKHADDMAFEEGSGRGYPEPSEDLTTTLAEIRALVLDALTTPETH